MTFTALPMIARRTFVPAQTRPFSNSTLSALRERLSGHMGFELARLELKWMREELRRRKSATVSVTSLPSHKRNNLEWEIGELGKMVDRRLQGEPLQYILGGYYGTALPSGLVFEASTDCVGVTRDWLSLKQQRVLCITLPRVDLLLSSSFFDRGGHVTDRMNDLYLYRQPTVWSDIDQDACTDLNPASGDRRLDDSLGIFTGG